MKCKCTHYGVNYIEVIAPRTTTEHTALACWQVAHGPQPKEVVLMTNQYGREALNNQPTPVAFKRLDR